MRCTIDASVFVASARSDEPNYLLSRKFLRDARSMKVAAPLSPWPKCAAAIARQTGDPCLARELISMIEDFPGINQISLDLSLARRAAQIAVEHRLRGGDAAYVAVADAFDAGLSPGSRDAEEMPSRSGDYDARELVRASVIKEEAIWQRRAECRAGPRFRRRAWGSGPACALASGRRS
ncbi:MAG: hypothetical protein JW999_08230 [Methanotrichaceae archaeon]|nr:hypothetical protein [Methanotrichaceae archaeon]